MGSKHKSDKQEGDKNYLFPVKYDGINICLGKLALLTSIKKNKFGLLFKTIHKILVVSFELVNILRHKTHGMIKALSSQYKTIIVFI